MADRNVTPEQLAKRGGWREKAKRKKAKPGVKPTPKVRARTLTDRYLRKVIVDGVPGYNPNDQADGSKFVPDAARKAIHFFEKRLTHVKGALARKPLLLEDWQRSIIANLFGWIRKDGTRRYRESLIYVPRKNGKTVLCAGILLYGLFEDDENGAEIYGAASEYKQASLVFDHARGMVLHDADLRDDCQIFKGQAKSIQRGEETGFSTYRVISSEADASHGFNTHMAVIDELHTQQNGDLVEALLTSVGARTQPMVVHITTADFEREGSVCNQKHDYACKVRDNGGDPEKPGYDPAFLPVIWEATREDDWTSPAVWKKANPNLGVSMSLEFIESQCKRAQETPTFENGFKRLHLNIRTEQDVRWLQLDKWDACGDEVDPEALEGCPCFAGLDLSSTTDITAFVLVFPDDDNAILPFFWIPSVRAHERERRDRVPYLTWKRSGSIEMTEGDVVDYDVIRRRIVGLSEIYDIRDIAIDRWNSTQLQVQLMGDGLTVTQFGQGFASMTAPTKELEKLVIAKQLRHGDHPVLRWMAQNVTVETDAAGNLKPSKKKSTEKIDGIVALIMALGRSMVQEDTTSAYEERGLLLL